MTTYNVQSSNPGLAVGTKTVLDGGAVVKVTHAHLFLYLYIYICVYVHVHILVFLKKTIYFVFI